MEKFAFIIEFPETQVVVAKGLDSEEDCGVINIDFVIEGVYMNLKVGIKDEDDLNETFEGLQDKEVLREFLVGIVGEEAVKEALGE